MFSVITIAHNHNRYTEMLLASLANPLCCDLEFELVFINNGSTDNTEELVKKYPLKNNPYFQKLTYHAFPENRGVAAAINQGVRLSQNAVILQADNDVIFGPKSFSCLGQWSRRHPGAVISPNWPWIQKKIGWNLFTSTRELTRKNLEHLYRVGMRAPLEKARATGSCWLCPKDLFLKVGGWDEGFLNACASDDFIWKIMLTGAPCFTVPCPVFHAGKITRGHVPRNEEQEHKDLARFQERWGAHPEDKRILKQKLKALAKSQAIPEGSEPEKTKKVRWLMLVAAWFCSLA
jgi:GT2 family glycosyltransferase